MPCVCSHARIRILRETQYRRREHGRNENVDSIVSIRCICDVVSLNGMHATNSEILRYYMEG